MEEKSLAKIGESNKEVSVTDMVFNFIDNFDLDVNGTFNKEEGMKVNFQVKKSRSKGAE